MDRKGTFTSNRWRRRAGRVLLYAGGLLSIVFALSARWWFGYGCETWLADLGDGTLYLQTIEPNAWSRPMVGWCGGDNNTWTWWTWGAENRTGILATRTASGRSHLWRSLAGSFLPGPVTAPQRDYGTTSASAAATRKSGCRRNVRVRSVANRRSHSRWGRHSSRVTARRE